MKQIHKKLQSFLQKVKNLVSLQSNAKLTYFHFSLILNLASICPASVAVVERRFSLVNQITNDLRSKTNACTLGAIMRIHYHDFIR